MPSGAPSHTTKSAFSPSKCAITCVPVSVVSAQGLQGLLPADLTGRCPSQKMQTAPVPGTQQARQQSDEEATQTWGSSTSAAVTALVMSPWICVTPSTGAIGCKSTATILGASCGLRESGQSGHNAVIERDRDALSTHLLRTHTLAHAEKASTRHSPSGLDGRQVQLSA